MIDIQDLSSDELSMLLKRLTLHADRKLNRLRWRGVRGGKPPSGVEADDLALEAITRVIDGRRSWDQSLEPDPLRFLKDVVDSLVSGLANSFDNRRTRRIGTPGSSGEGAVVHEIAGREIDPAQFVADRESATKFRTPIIAALAGDEIAAQVFECLEGDITKPSEIADLLGVPVHEINNAQKRLYRKVEKALKTTRRGQSS